MPCLINAYLQAIGEDPVNLDAFRTLPSPTCKARSPSAG